MPNPALAKILSQMAIDVAVDEKKRKTVLMIILARVITLLLLIAFILYILTSPLSLIADFFMPDELTEIESMQYQYGYNQTLGIYEKDYEENYGQNYEGIVFAQGETEVMHYNQLDERWADIMYGTSGTIGEAGCGPTAMSIVISTFLGEPYDPVELSNWSVDNGYRAEGNGSYHALIPAATEAYGLSVEGDLDGQGIVDALSSGELVVAIMSKGHFTNSGHFIVLRGITEDGKILVADPASYSRSEQEWDLSIILDESNKAYAAGDPYWAISLP